MIVQELVSFGSLLDYLQQNADKIKPNFELKIWASQIACGKRLLFFPFYFNYGIMELTNDIFWRFFVVVVVDIFRYALFGNSTLCTS